MTDKVISIFKNSDKPAQTGYYVAYCPVCLKEKGRMYLPENTEHLSIVCKDCNHECLLVYVSQEEIERSSGVWTKVVERTPDKPGHYLVTSDLNYYFGGNRDKSKDGSARSVAVAYFDITGNWNHAGVVAWMSLPEVYQG